MGDCKCSMRIKLVGDGCRYCNPQYWINHFVDERDELQSRIEELEEALYDIDDYEADHPPQTKGVERPATPIQLIARKGLAGNPSKPDQENTNEQNN